MRCISCCWYYFRNGNHSPHDGEEGGGAITSLTHPKELCPFVVLHAPCGVQFPHEKKIRLEPPSRVRLALSNLSKRAFYVTQLRVRCVVQLLPTGAVNRTLEAHRLDVPGGDYHPGGPHCAGEVMVPGSNYLRHWFARLATAGTGPSRSRNVNTPGLRYGSTIGRRVNMGHAGNLCANGGFVLLGTARI